ncbi:hypothetical protein HPO_01190 [Hyphomonas polymorpha PS728]|uniref:Uncharacterized protein n=1 Tax=Hyphomonas polymorpha PS728 TaxID=1280954 RepID=A0A062VJD0_9PROT|nr:hypothetical protein HPO_01190 [Hyphomonas polymorpha PS728]
MRNFPGWQGGLPYEVVPAWLFGGRFPLSPPRAADLDDVDVAQFCEQDQQGTEFGTLTFEDPAQL